MAGGSTRYQLDNIIARKMYQSQVKQSKSYHGADIDSDHNLVTRIMESTLSLKILVNKQITRKRWYLDKLKNEEIRHNYSKKVNNKLKKLQKQDQNKLYGINEE